MADSEFWNWSDEQLLHPDGRAKGGEPCVQCGDPIPINAHWKQRDRHVCSARCNRNLRLRQSRRIKRGAVVPPVQQPPPRVHAGAILFRTVPEAAFPYEFLGWAPYVGDVVERHGSLTAYLPAGSLMLDGEDHIVGWCVHLNSGARALVKAEPDGRVGGVWYECLNDGGARIRVREPFADSDGNPWVWTWETFRDVDATGRSYSWSAPVCTAQELRGPLWTPAYQEWSRHRRRVSSSTAQHARRQRMTSPGGVIERIDPVEIYERDRWWCQLCGQPIDPGRSHPDLLSASLDHKVPLAAGGEHRRSNVWAAHLGCNIRKGARSTAM